MTDVVRLPLGRLPKELRVRRRADYQRIQVQGQRLLTSHFIFVLASRPADLSQVRGARLGIAVSRKIGNAVVRNRVKRLVREAFRAMRSSFGGDVDIVVIARSPKNTWGLAEVIAEWNSACERIVRIIAHLALARRV